MSERLEFIKSLSGKEITQPNIEISLPKTRISAATFQKAYDQAEKLEPGFKAKLQKVAKTIGANEIDLVKVMYKESGLN